MNKLITKHSETYLASCPRGMEEILEKEIIKIGVKSTQVEYSAVSFDAYNEKALEVLLSSRIASRLQKKLFSFEFKDEKDFYHLAKEIKWKSIFDVDQTFKVASNIGFNSEAKKESMFKNSIYLNQLLKDSIVDRFRSDVQERPNIDRENPEVVIYVFVVPNSNPHSRKEVAHIYAELSGKLLSNRGYRSPQALAPVRENLAAGLLSIIDAPVDGDFYDVMCGSGTFIIEEFIRRYKICPQLLHLEDQPWIFKNLKWFKKDKYLKDNFDELVNTFKSKSEKAINKALTDKKNLLASDLNETPISQTADALKAFGIKDCITLKKIDFLDLKPLREDKITIFANPPYGERLQQVHLNEFYHLIGEHLKNNFKNSKAYLFSSNDEGLKTIRLNRKKEGTFKNGPLTSHLVSIDLY